MALLQRPRYSAHSAQKYEIPTSPRDLTWGRSKKEGMEEEEEMDANPAEARCKGYLSSLRKRRKKG